MQIKREIYHFPFGQLTKWENQTTYKGCGFVLNTKHKPEGLHYIIHRGGIAIRIKSYGLNPDFKNRLQQYGIPLLNFAEYTLPLRNLK